MRLVTRLLALAGLFMVGLSTWVQAADPPLRYRIDLQAPLAQQPWLMKHLDLYRWQDNPRMDEPQLQRLARQAPEQIRTLLATEGYYSPDIHTHLQPSEQGWEVQIKVEPGKPVKVSTLDLQLGGPISQDPAQSRERLAELRKAWALPPGSVFRHADWEAAKRGALRGLLLERYPTASIETSQATVDTAQRTAALSLRLDSGPAFRFGPLSIKGLQRYPASIVERLNPISPGSDYNQAKLLEFQSRLQNSAYFASSRVQVETDREHPEAIPIEVIVEENQARTLGLGIGASTDIGPRAQIDYRDLNLLGQAWRLNSNLKIATRQQVFGGELLLPQTKTAYRDSFNASLTRTDVEGQVTRTLVLGAARSKSLGKKETVYRLSYFGEQQDVAGSTSDWRSALVPSVAWTWRDVDNLLFPTSGSLLSVQTDVAAQSVFSDRSFVRGQGKAVWFKRLGQHDRLILRGELGAVVADSRDGIPSEFLFRTGGDQTVRGYAYQSLGVSEGDAIVGGRWLGVASAEYVHWLQPGNWGLAAFVDAGDAADQFADLSARLGYGLGVRWRSPVGPLALDLAYGRKTEELRLHFSLGFSF